MQPTDIWEENLDRGITQIRLGYGLAYSGIILLSKLCRRIQSSVGSTIPRQVVLSWIKKSSHSTMSLWANQRVRKQPTFFHGFCFSSCLDFLQWWTVTQKCKPNKPFPHLSCYGHDACSSNRKGQQIEKRDGKAVERYVRIRWDDTCMTMFGISKNIPCGNKNDVYLLLESLQSV